MKLSMLNSSNAWKFKVLKLSRWKTNFKLDSLKFRVELLRQNKLNIALMQRNVFATDLKDMTCLNIKAIDSNVTSEFKISKFQD